MGKKRRTPIYKETLRLYLAQIKKFRLSIVIAMIAIPLGALSIDTLLPYFASQAIGSLAENADLTNAINMTIITGIVAIIGALLNYVGFQSLVRHESNITRSLVNATFETVINKDMTFFKNQKTGAMTSNFINFVHSHVGLQDLFVIRTLGFLLSVGSGLIILAFTAWPLSVLLTVFLVLLIFQIRWSVRRREKWRTARRKIRSDMHGNIADAITNNLIVKTFVGEEKELAAVSEQSLDYQKMYRKDILFVSTEGSVRVLLMGIIQTIALALCVYLISESLISVALAIFVIAYMQRIGSQLFTLGEMLNGYDQALLDAQPMTEMLLAENSVRDDDSPRDLTYDIGEIIFDDISYRYSDGNTDVLDSVSLTIPSGQKIGLVGPSGAGKSTIIQLLLRFSDVTKGSILIDGQDIRKVTQKSIRNAIAYVPQEPMLFHRTLRDNIAYGKASASDEQIIESAKKANAWEFIKELPHGLDTLVGERGVKLSGGQRQRIAIARAILKDAPILVLDEATSALDSESEKLIQSSLETLMKGRTAIVIAHRLSTIAKLDRIIVLDQGKIVEDGTHDELIKTGKTYAKLWQHQSGGFIQE